MRSRRSGPRRSGRPRGKDAAASFHAGGRREEDSDPDRRARLQEPQLSWAERREQARLARERSSRRDRERRRQEAQLSWADRKRLALEDLATYRTVSFADLCEARFGGNEFAARRAVSQMRGDGLLVRGRGRGPRGGEFLVLALTKAGRRLAGRRMSPFQRTWHGLAKPREAHHDTAIYRVALEKIAELEAKGCYIATVRIDAELKGELAKASEKARYAGGEAAARRARLARAQELGLPAKGGKVQIPDVQVQYERPDRTVGIASVEVVTGSYRNGAVRAKAAAGFSLAASGELGRKRIEAAMGGASGGAPRPDLGETEGRGGMREVEEWGW